MFIIKDFANAVSLSQNLLCCELHLMKILPLFSLSQIHCACPSEGLFHNSPPEKCMYNGFAFKDGCPRVLSSFLTESF